MTITVLGDGAFGTALAQVFARNGHNVALWCYSSEVAKSIAQQRMNDLYLPGILLQDSIIPVTSLHEAMVGQEGASPPSWIVEAIPMIHIESVLNQAKDHYIPGIPWVLTSKGIEPETHLLPSEILSRTFQQEVPTLILSGPSFARELALGIPTGVTVASTHQELITRFINILRDDTLTFDSTNDVIGTQLYGALKNVIALALGILEGANYGINTQALIFTKAVHELSSYAQSRGAQMETLLMLTGIGDLTLTAFTSQSRNKLLGKALGKGISEQKIVPYTEGLTTLRSIPALLGNEYPILRAVHEIVFEKKEIHLLLDACTKKGP